MNASKNSSKEKIKMVGQKINMNDMSSNEGSNESPELNNS